jgi:hypothetical protein
MYQICYVCEYHKLTISLPKGLKAIAVSLKCCRPKGIPIIVMQRITPKIRWVAAMHNPPVSSHNTFIKMYRHPEALGCTRVSLPKGHNASDAILSVCRPKGMPTIVTIRMILPIKYSIAIIMPPNINQMIFPIRFIMLPELIIQE